MSSESLFDLQPDLRPIYPNVLYLSSLLSSNSGLNPNQRAELVSHCLTRACVFAELNVLQFLLAEQQAQPYVDLAARDDHGIGLVTLAIHGFGAESDRDIEREECVRLLISQGADLSPDEAGWTPLHHAALLSPPTLISYLMTHGCSVFALTRRNLTPLDIVTAHSVLPGREDVALLLEEAMRGEGWTGGKLEEKRRLLDEKRKRLGKQRAVKDGVEKALGLDTRWWGASDHPWSDSDSEDEDADEDVYTPPPDYSSMLVFSPPALPQIFESLITNFRPSFRDSQPANSLYMLARFACLACDHTWLEDLIIGAADAIEEAFFERADDITCLVFWLRNTTIWLHLLRCDNSINETCELLGSFELIEEVINSVFVFIIRYAERRIDQLLDAALLDFSPLPAEMDSVQFESEWSFLRSLTGKRKAAPPAPPPPALRAVIPPTPPSPNRPASPSGSISASTSRGFSSLRQSFARARAGSQTTPIQAFFSDGPPPTSAADVTSFLTALHTLLTLSDVNPALTTQLWSQVMYWTSCEMFNRILTRKKYICRSRAMQISMNLMALEEWVEQMGLPRGVQSHFNPVRDLLNWLQCLSSITDFPNLVATIQTLQHINPLQMRRAVREYKYEVNEGRMTEECVQYLTQLQKDWERHRVKLGVEALRKERDTDRDSVSSFATESHSNSGIASTPSIASSESSMGQHGIDLLFERTQEKAAWEPVKPPQVLGELLDSRHMLPLAFPSDPRMLSALPVLIDDKPTNALLTPDSRSSSRASEGPGNMQWRSRDRTLREVEVGTLQWVDGIRSAARWRRVVNPAEEEEFGDGVESESLKVDTHITPLTRKPSGRSKGRPSQGGDAETTPVE